MSVSRAPRSTSEASVRRRPGIVATRAASPSSTAPDSSRAPLLMHRVRGTQRTKPASAPRRRPSAPCSLSAWRGAWRWRVPALDVRIAVEIDGLPFVARHPRPDRDVGDRIGVGDQFVVGKPPVEHAIEPVRLLQIAFLRIRRLARIVFGEVMHLAEHRPRAAHLPHQPFDGAVARLAGLRQQLAGLVGEIDQDRAGFHQAHPVVAVDDRRNAIVRADFQEFGLELLVLADVDGVDGIGQSHFLERDEAFRPFGIVQV